MGAADVVPGVSGGTMALILGIYPRLIGALGALTERRTWRAVLRGRARETLVRIDAGFLLALVLGIAAAVVSASGLLLELLATQRALVYAFFVGLIGASVWVVARQIERRTLGAAAALVAGAAAAIVVTGLPPLATGTAAGTLFLVGALAICALVLPGISGAFILLLLGQYERVLGAIRSLDLVTLAPFAIGALTGLLAFTRVLKWLLVHRPSTTLALLVGFLAGSLRAVWPWQAPEGALEGAARALQAPPSAASAAIALGLALAGAALVIVLERIGARRAPETAAR